MSVPAIHRALKQMASLEGTRPNTALDGTRAISASTPDLEMLEVKGDHILKYADSMSINRVLQLVNFTSHFHQNL